MMFFRTALIAVALVASACAGGAGPSTQAPQPAQGTPAPEPAVTISFWHGQSGVLGDRLNDLVSKFNASHKTQVTGTFQGMYDQLYQKIVSAIQAGSVPDMAMVSGPPQTAQYLKAKAIVPVQQFVDSRDGFSGDQLKDFVPALLDDNSLPVNGKKTLVSWPFSKSVALLYYNPDVLKAAGVSVPTTWEQLRAALKTVKEKTTATPFAWTPDVYYFFLPYLWSQGGEALTPDLSKAAFNTPEGIAALQYQVDLVLGDKTAQVTQGFDWQNPFAQGKVAFAVSTSVSRPFIEQAMPADKKFRVGMAPLPAGPKGAKTDLFGNNLVIFAKAPADNQRAAWLFMKWLTETDQTVAWSLASGYMPLRDSARNAPAFKAETDKDDRLLVAINALKDAHGIPGSPDWQKVQPVMGDAITKALLGQASAKDALTEAEKKVNDTLSGF
ncbi:MAG: ABC transporter substrate-binding protein [Chloroflexi bacterium]|nr:MAG: ABC transporter substrate-binding protein [Chloroflexota bacterium]TMF66561.1 MAG: ABC transporter substrate-binding protein [Chloroflexota bacterium]TMG39741.1 MAG: ABC transporter substrate-binding protein [Chloroflexota bacterium]